MGSFIELNDTLQITTEQGFPASILNRKKHTQNPINISEVEGKVFSFHSKPSARVYHHAPTRCFLVHNIDGKWLYWGHVLILEQTITGKNKDTHMTAGKFTITQLYKPEYQEMITRHESPDGQCYFDI
ncbi:hypothetical protein H6758_03720 [Candidatus Nomurabacteria bacterium]|nr:hypothetical protein [Candidatus Nomurabacteria bacterium]